MKLEAISVCVDYDDFLAQTAKLNKGIFDKYVIVTDTKDVEVSKICDLYGYTCIKTDIFYANGAKFNKWAGINEGLKHLDRDGWVLFLDSDIVLQKETRRVLENIKLDKTFIYGIDRVNCTGYEMWDKFQKTKKLSYANWILTTGDLEFGARLVHYYGMQGENGRFEGYRPLGFFQLVWGKAFDLYPQDSLTADHCDLVFARQWPREKRLLIPELFGIHLETKANQMAGPNWGGRKTPRFEPAPPPVKDPMLVFLDALSDGLAKKNEEIKSRKVSRWKRILISFGLAKSAA